MKSHHVKNTFNKAADHYDLSCELQLNTGTALIDLLKNHYTYTNNMLDVGCGTGIVTKELASAFQYKTFYAIDIADQLLLQAKEKLHKFNVHVELADYNHMHDIHVEFDFIYANLSLHWSNDFASTLISMHGKLNKNGTLAFSIPLLGTFQEIENYCSINKFFSSSQIEAALTRAGFNIIQIKSQYISFDFDNLLKALKSIKSVGTNYVAKENRKKITHLKKYIQMNNESFKLSYHIGYFIINKL